MSAKSRIAMIAVACVFAAAAKVQPTAQIVPQAREISFFQIDRAEAMARYGHPNEMWRYSNCRFATSSRIAAVDASRTA